MGLGPKPLRFMCLKCQASRSSGGRAKLCSPIKASMAGTIRSKAILSASFRPFWEGLPAIPTLLPRTPPFVPPIL